MKEKEVSIPAGFVWKEETMDLEALTKDGGSSDATKRKKNITKRTDTSPGDGISGLVMLFSFVITY